MRHTAGILDVETVLKSHPHSAFFENGAVDSPDLISLKWTNLAKSLGDYRNCPISATHLETCDAHSL